MESRVVFRDGLDALIARLKGDGYAVIGPRIADEAIVYDAIDSTNDLPEGWGDQQEGGKYRLVKREGQALFGYNLGPTSWKRFLFPPRTELLHIRQSNGQMTVREHDAPAKSLAFFGVRSCELAAIAIQDQVFLGSGHVDRTYAAGRNDVFLVAINCATSAATCFCTSMGTGPQCYEGFDLVITELAEREPPEYVVASGSERGAEILGTLEARPAEDLDIEAVEATVTSTIDGMTRAMSTDGLRDLLVDNPDHPRWEEVASRCLACGNCTQACPTCFCSDTSDTVTLDGEATRWRTWDSCFSLDFSAIHGHPVRESVKSRYRQWMTHKLATWHDQFGTSGCVGCGRCITWCPVGIDITAEVGAIRATVPA